MGAKVEGNVDEGKLVGIFCLMTFFFERGVGGGQEGRGKSFVADARIIWFDGTARNFDFGRRIVRKKRTREIEM